MLGFQGGVSIPLVKGGVKAPPAKRECRAGPKAGARRGFTFELPFTMWAAEFMGHKECSPMLGYAVSLQSDRSICQYSRWFKLLDWREHTWVYHDLWYIGPPM